MSAPWFAYRVIAPVVGAVAPAVRIFTGPKQRALWNERLAEIDAEPDPGCDAWIHAASLGEAAAVPPLARALVAHAPGVRLVFTANTPAGRKRLLESGGRALLAPLDAPQIVARFLARVRPRRVLLVETELWPHWLMRARGLRIPVAVVSGRLSAHSVARYRGLGGGFRSLVRDLAGVVCQTHADAERWLEIGARRERLAVGGNLKFDALPEPAADRRAARAALGLDPDRPLLTLGSLRPGEVRPWTAAWRGLPRELTERWQVVAVPRHRRATAELQAEAGRSRELGWRWDGRPGVLAAYYAAADLAFVGGSLAPWGGHNPLEPAACGAAVLTGPHHGSQRDAVRALLAAHAVLIVKDVVELRAALGRLLPDLGSCAERGRLARAAALALGGAARRTVAQLEAWDLWPPA